MTRRFTQGQGPPEALQQVEIVACPTSVTEHQGLAYWCPHCRKFHYAPFSEAVKKAGLFGPRLTALVAFMKGVCHALFSTIRRFLRDVVRVDVSRGYVQTDDEETWASRIERRLKCAASEYAVRAELLWRRERIVDGPIHTYRSKHGRGQGRRPIEIYHTLLRFS